MNRLKGLLAASLFALATIPAAQALPLYFGAFLTGPSESPANASPGIGMALVGYHPFLHTMTVQVTFKRLLGVTTASHIHCCVTVPNGTAGVATELPSFSNLPLGVHKGGFSQAFDTLLDSSYSPAFEAAHGGTAAGAEAALLFGLENQEAYLNIHTSLFPAGEIRGFIFGPVAIHFSPEPASLALLSAGLLGAFGVRRRRRNSSSLKG